MLSLLLDPISRSSFLGTMLMCLSSSLMGTYLFVRKRVLIGEALSHATYPGVVIGITLGGWGLSSFTDWMIPTVLTGAFIFSFLGLVLIEKLNKRYRIDLDAAMSLILSLFLGWGVTAVSYIQFRHPIWYQQAQTFIYGQAATMNDYHVLLYGFFSLCTTAFVIIRFRQIEMIAFDRFYAKSLGLKLKSIDLVIFSLVVLAIVVGIRSVGVVMMAGMLISPTVSAISFTHRFSHVMFLSAIFGILSGFGGNYFSIFFSKDGLSLPTGPMILLFSVFISFASLLFSPKKGAISRFIRIFFFRRKCISENILKTFWQKGIEKKLTIDEIERCNPMVYLKLRWYIFSLKREGWVQKLPSGYRLTVDGVKKATNLVRLHRLWELYLTSCLNIDEKRVHHSAEEMEHILNSELEHQLTTLLKNPKKDPHKKPIPESESI